MLVLLDLVIFEVIVAAELGVASSHGVRSFQQIVAKETVAGFDKGRILGLEVAGLVLFPDEAGVLGYRSLGLKAVDIANLGDDTGGIDLADAGDGGQRVRDDIEHLLDRFLQVLDLLLNGADRGDGDGHGLIDRIVERLGQAEGTPRCGLNRFRGLVRVGEATPAGGM